MASWKNVLMSPASAISEAIKVLDEDEAKIVLVVDAAGHLLGTITDGDIRRGLLRGLTLNAEISEVMNREPKVVYQGESRETVRSRMESLSVRQMPVVDKYMVVQGLETLKSLSDSNKLDNPVFLMAGGFGTRLRPLTDNTPKPMLRVGDKPILERILESFVQMGFHEFYISTHYKAEMVRNHFGDGGRWGVNIHYVHEEQPLGTAGALGLLPESITKLPIIMMNGDILTNVNYRQLLEFHESHGGMASVCVKGYEFQVPYGVVEGNNHEVRKITEKPIQRFFINAGIYLLGSELLAKHRGARYLEMPAFLESLIESGGKVTMFPIHEYWLDIGRMDEFERAQDEVSWVMKNA